MQEHVISANTLDDQEQVAQMFSKYNFLALPVVDTENRLVGIISQVSELKERIDRQIVVAKDPDGSSHAELVI